MEVFIKIIISIGIFGTFHVYANTPNSRDINGLTPLHLAAGVGDSKEVSRLLNQSADLYSLDSKMGVSVLHKAVYSGDPKTVKLLLESSALVNIQSPSNGNTPLHDAIYFKGVKGIEIIKLLLKHGANLSIKNRAALTPIESAQLLKDVDVKKILDEHLTSRHDKIAVELMNYVKKNDLSAVSSLLKSNKVNLSEVDDQGFTPLIWSARMGYTDIVKLLLEKGADPNQNDQWMRANAGHKAAFWGQSEVIKLLIQHGLDLNAQGGYNGYTPLHDAVARAHNEVIDILLQAGAKTDIRGHDGKTALDIAIGTGNKNVISLLSKELR